MIARYDPAMVRGRIDDARRLAGVVVAAVRDARRPLDARFPPDFSPEDIRVAQAVTAYTMTSPERLFALMRALEYIEEHAIEGDIVECGVWRGGSMMAAAMTLKRLDNESRPIHLFDTFEGMPAPDEIDRTHTGARAEDLMRVDGQLGEAVLAAGPLEDVKHAMETVGYAGPISYIKGKVEDTIPESAPSGIALLRLDTDWYSSTLHELEHLYPRLAPGGVLIVDDYGHWEGARKAVDEYFMAHAPRPLLHRIDYTGRSLVKPA